MTIFRIDETLVLSKVIRDKYFELLVKNIDSSIKLVAEFNNTYIKQKEKLPYHLNLIDELHANENAHSRILIKLLSYEKGGKFPLLDSFIKFLISKYDMFHFVHIISNPKITSEKHRIDALIIEKDYAIIIENKIHDAKDQPEQIKRYIQKINELSIKNPNIYIFYLSKWKSSPKIESFSDSLKEEFSNRYLELSYRYDIISWLETQVIPKFSSEEEYLTSALQQYQDHLKGIFQLRKIDITMEKELIRTIETQLNLHSDYRENINILNKTISDIDKTKSYLNRVLLYNWFKIWLENIEKKYTDFELVKDFEDMSNYPKVGIVLCWKEIKFSILIEMEDNLYIGVRRYGETDMLNEEIKSFLNDVLINYKFQPPWWFGWKYVKTENAYNEFEILVEKIIEKVKSDKNSL